jgi:hypothetical protein
MSPERSDRTRPLVRCAAEAIANPAARHQKTVAVPPVAPGRAAGGVQQHGGRRSDVRSATTAHCLEPELLGIAAAIDTQRLAEALPNRGWRDVAHDGIRFLSGLDGGGPETSSPRSASALLPNDKHRLRLEPRPRARPAALSRRSRGRGVLSACNAKPGIRKT